MKARIIITTSRSRRPSAYLSAIRFMILREKFGRLFLDVEYHWDTGHPFGTAKPFIQLDGPVSPGKEREVLDAKHNEIPFADYMARTNQWCQQP